MQPVFLGKVVDCIPTETGLVFAYCKWQEEKPTLAYQMVTFENGRMMPVEAELYRLAKFGANYKAVCTQVGSVWQDRVLRFPGEQMLILGHDGMARLLDSNAVTLYYGSLQYKGERCSAGGLQDGHLWCTYADQNLLIRYNAATMREELRIGGQENSPFLSPVDLWIENRMAYVCNREAMQVLRLDLRTFAMEVTREFTEPLYRYFHSGAYAFAVTASGLYLL